jgi:hypothetical protein
MKRIARLLMLAGLAVCLGGAGLAVIDAYIHLPPEAVKAIAMLLPFVIGGAMLVVGAIMGRAASREAERDARAARAAIGAGAPGIGASSPQRETLRSRHR